ncbi:hypothetical protein UPYG_G00245680 [Umbra pygmaea]|uniref:C-type lectin domain-containing protein n=1 Tax=Umbra pygmaea TaxID=75934 RepID=A0ABD0WG98_UMBPY
MLHERTLTKMVLMFLTLSAAFALASGRLGEIMPCPHEWVKFESRCFHFERTSMSWPNAERRCLSLGGNLASVHNSAESHFLKELTSGSHSWIGGFDAAQAKIEKDRLWFWSDGSVFDYQNWADGEPNNFNGVREPCILIFGEGHRWNDEVCEHSFPSLCSMELN